MSGEKFLTPEVWEKSGRERKTTKGAFEIDFLRQVFFADHRTQVTKLEDDILS